MKKCNELMMQCFDEIEKNHGLHALRRYQRLLENNSTDRELSEQEILGFKELFENELARTMFTREGK